MSVHVYVREFTCVCVCVYVCVIKLLGAGGGSDAAKDQDCILRL